MTSRPVLDEGDREAARLGYSDANCDRYGEYFADVLTGKGDFWPTVQGVVKTPVYDNEQQWAIFDAVQAACRCPALDDDGRWKLVERAVAALAHDYADYMVNR